jgi:hypothetical protein
VPSFTKIREKWSQEEKLMKIWRYLTIGASISGGLLAVAIATHFWGPLAKADGSSQPVFAVDASWPQPLPAPVGSDGVAHAWVQGEVAGNCTDSRDNIFTFNRGWEVGVTYNGVLQGSESGAINGNDATPGGRSRLRQSSHSIPTAIR